MQDLACIFFSAAYLQYLDTMSRCHWHPGVFMEHCDVLLDRCL